MPQLKELNSQSWDDRLEARAHTYQLRGRFKFARERLVERRPRRWLDIGTGNGFLPKIARPLLGDVHITGTDFAPNALEAAGKALDEGIVNDIDREGLPFEDQSFDFVTCLEVLEHFVFPQNALREIHRVLRPQGYLILTVPNLQFIEYLGQLIRGKMPGPASDPRHMSVFTHRFLDKMLKECNFNMTVRSGCEASPEWLAHVSPRYFCRTIAVEAQKQ
ncbi:class I SAM-dependent methyltransferase [candidate division KSB1 bacterium]|nr:MAG: class I SAM-dependent methyltransferase [candidate division KSB1 bacterium]